MSYPASPTLAVIIQSTLVRRSLRNALKYYSSFSSRGTRFDEEQEDEETVSLILLLAFALNVTVVVAGENTDRGGGGALSQTAHT